MEKIKKLFSKKIVAGIAVFAAAALVLQGIASLVMTPAGLDILYPYLLAVRSDEIKTGDAGIGEYFSLHKDIEDAGIIIISVDPDVEASYKLAADYLNFLGKFTHISAAAVYTSNSRLRSISDAVVKGDYESFSKVCSNHRKSKTLSDQFFLFLENVYSMNTRLTPDNKIKITGFKGYKNYKDLLGALTTDLFSSAPGFYGEYTEVISASSAEEYAELIRKHETVLADVLGDKFTDYADTLDAVLDGTVEEAFAVKNLVKYAPPGDGAVFVVAPRELCNDGSVFMEQICEIYGKAVVTDTVYYNCTTLDGKEEVSLNDGDFPGFIKGIRIAGAEELRGFREYYDKVCGSDGDTKDVIGDAGNKTFFIISGSDCVTFLEDKKEEIATANTVLVAPGQ